MSDPTDLDGEPRAEHLAAFINAAEWAEKRRLIESHADLVSAETGPGPSPSGTSERYSSSTVQSKYSASNTDLSVNFFHSPSETPSGFTGSFSSV